MSTTHNKAIKGIPIKVSLAYVTSQRQLIFRDEELRRAGAHIRRATPEQRPDEEETIFCSCEGYEGGKLWHNTIIPVK